MKHIILDDDPTGTQCATDVSVLLGLGVQADTVVGRLITALRSEDAVFILTNSRALSPGDAVDLVTRIRDAAVEAASILGIEQPRFILRGDSTLRGHVFAESDIFATENSVLLFVPAFPSGGRVTRHGIHYVQLGEHLTPAAETEYARDPVFGFTASDMAGYVHERGGLRPVVSVPLDSLRTSAGHALTHALITAESGAVVAPDAVTNADIGLVHRGLVRAWAEGRNVVVRCAAPLAAYCAQVYSSDELLAQPLERPAGGVLVVCGSHTSGATTQLDALASTLNLHAAVLDTDTALADPESAGRDLAARARADLASRGVAVIASERQRRNDDNTLVHGARVMRALTTAVHVLRDDVAAVVAKGGITSAEVAFTGLGATTARVRGQLSAGVSVWDLAAAGGAIPYVVVPGNVGSPDVLVAALRALDGA
ncbi:four-carbon acid sugar kinase family protein [Nocardia sp. CWNU-33]|uniref:four-carbon acid sugar kinase family protein n=1 Tax=Nocardia sp. CWNU-33 TaxID=3392117 RepID=UPI00398F3D23